jgi:hypothetical protein
MKTVLHTGIKVIACILILSAYAYSQDESDYDLTIQMNTSVSSITVDATEFDDIKRFTDIDRHFKSEWVQEFLSIEVIIFRSGHPHMWNAKDDNITDDLRQAILNADSGSPIKVSYEYIAKNALDKNSVHTDGYTFTMLPDNDASFPGGDHNMNEYLVDAGLNKIEKKDIDTYNLAAVKFTVTESGHIEDAYIASKSKKAEVDKLLLNAVCNMPLWVPASYNDGVTVSQEYVLSIGDHGSCTVNVLNIHKYALK